MYLRVSNWTLPFWAGGRMWGAGAGGVLLGHAFLGDRCVMVVKMTMIPQPMALISNCSMLHTLFLSLTHTPTHAHGGK